VVLVVDHVAVHDVLDVRLARGGHLPASGGRFIMPVVSDAGAPSIPSIPSIPSTPSTRGETWNSPQRIAIHRGLTPSARLRLTIEASRAALRFAEGERIDERRASVRA
jgi:hypothetical protein